MEEKLYTIHALCASDVFPMLKILNKIGFKEIRNSFKSEEVMKAIKKYNENTDKNDEGIEGVGLALIVDLAGIVIEHIPDCEQEIYAFLEGVSGMKKADIAALPMGTFFEMIMDVFSGENFADFFQVVLKRMK